MLAKFECFLLYSWIIETFFPKWEYQKLQTMQLKCKHIASFEIWISKVQDIWNLELSPMKMWPLVMTLYQMSYGTPPNTKYYGHKSRFVTYRVSNQQIFSQMWYNTYDIYMLIFSLIMLL